MNWQEYTVRLIKLNHKNIRIYGETDKTESQKYYQEIINKFPSSPLVDSAKMELQKLQKN